MHLLVPVEHGPLGWEPAHWVDSCTEVPEWKEHCSSCLSFAASAAEDTEDSVVQPQSFVYRMACTVTVMVAVGIVRMVRGYSLVVARQYKSSPLLQERWEHWSLTWDKVQQVVEEPEDCNRQWCAGHTPWINVLRAFDHNSGRQSTISHVGQEGCLVQVSLDRISSTWTKLTVFAHCLSIRAGELWSEGADRIVKLLDLGFAQNSPGWLRLEAVHQSSKKVDVFGFNRGELIIVLGKRESRGRGRASDVGGLLLEGGRMSLLLLLHICERGGNRGLEIFIFLLRNLGNRRGLLIRLRFGVFRRLRVTTRVTLYFLQAHSQSPL